MKYELYEDGVRKDKVLHFENRCSPYCDFIYYPSSRQPELKLAMRVLKPAKPSYILAGTHGWHMSIPDFVHMEAPQPGIQYLTLEVDMRGRAYSTGTPDCNGWELLDVIDAVNYARMHYKEYILDSEVVYFEAGSGGGGNAFSIVGKFPDFFAAATALYGISDYGKWYEEDMIGEFRDEMDVWIEGTPADNAMAYRSRSGLYSLENLHTPLFVAHGETDARVPVEQARSYIKRAGELGKEGLVKYMELEGVGTRDHLGNATPGQVAAMEEGSEKNRLLNCKAVEIPDSGRMVVAGYLVTKKFTVVLDSLDKVAVLEYDLKEDVFRVKCDVACTYEIKRCA